MAPLPSPPFLTCPPPLQIIELNLIVWVGYYTDRNAGNAIKELEASGFVGYGLRRVQLGRLMSWVGGLGGWVG